MSKASYSPVLLSVRMYFRPLLGDGEAKPEALRHIASPAAFPSAASSPSAFASRIASGIRHSRRT